VWEGRDGSHRKMENGTYQLVLHAWDLAGDHSVDARMVAMQASALPVTVATFNENGKTFLRVESADEKGFPLSSWSLDATSLQGESLVKVEGTDLPVMIELPPLEGKNSIMYNFEGEDFLGNHLRMAKKKVEISSPDKKAAEGTQAKSWVSDF